MSCICAAVSHMKNRTLIHAKERQKKISAEPRNARGGQGVGLLHAGSAQFPRPVPSRANHLRKTRGQKKHTRTSTSDGEQENITRNSTVRVSPSAAATDNSATTTAHKTITVPAQAPATESRRTQLASSTATVSPAAAAASN